MSTVKPNGLSYVSADEDDIQNRRMRKASTCFFIASLQQNRGNSLPSAAKPPIRSTLTAGQGDYDTEGTSMSHRWHRGAAPSSQPVQGTALSHPPVVNRIDTDRAFALHPDRRAEKTHRSIPHDKDYR